MSIRKKGFEVTGPQREFMENALFQESHPATTKVSSIKDYFDGLTAEKKEELLDGMKPGPGDVIMVTPSTPGSIIGIASGGIQEGDVLSVDAVTGAVSPVTPAKKVAAKKVPAPAVPTLTPARKVTGLLSCSRQFRAEEMGETGYRDRAIYYIKETLQQQISKSLDDGREYLIRTQTIIENSGYSVMPRDMITVHAVASVAVAEFNAAVPGEYFALSDGMRPYRVDYTVERLALPGHVGHVTMWRKR